MGTATTVFPTVELADQIPIYRERLGPANSHNAYGRATIDSMFAELTNASAAAVAAAVSSEAAKDLAELAKIDAELAKTASETAQTNAEAAEVGAVAAWAAAALDAAIVRSAITPAAPWDGMLWWYIDTSVDILRIYDATSGVWSDVFIKNRTTGAVQVFETVILATGNWNSYTDTGLYTGDALTNAPTAIAGSHTRVYVTVTKYTTDWVVQVARDLNGCATWQRVLLNTVWGSWELIWSKRILLSGNGHLTGVNAISLVKVGSAVTMTWADMTHASNHTLVSDAGLIPAAYRPAVTLARSPYRYQAGIVRAVEVRTNGEIRFHYGNTTTGATANYESTDTGTVSWTV